MCAKTFRAKIVSAQGNPEAVEVRANDQAQAERIMRLMFPEPAQVLCLQHVPPNDQGGTEV